MKESMMQRKIESTKINFGKRHAAGRQAQRGATLVEAIAFLGIAALILLGAVALLRSAYSSAHSNALTEEVTAIQSAVRTTYGDGIQLQTNLGSGIAGLVAANALPSTLQVDASNAVTNAWGGAVTVGWDATNAAAEISYKSVPKSACVAALTNSGNFSTVSTDTKTTPAAAPLVASDAIAACGSDSNTVNWEFTS
jgi:type II secretory pathway pseudopilin PulG